MRRWLLNQVCRWVVRPHLARQSDHIKARSSMERAARWNLRKPRNMRVVDYGTHAEVSLGSTDETRVIFYLHGGGYIAGSPTTHAAMAARLSALTGLRVILPRYALAPENPAPAQFDAAVGAFDRLLDSGISAENVALGGDSAGGGLALSLLSHLCTTDQRPACGFFFSPWTDLALTGESLKTNAARDRLLPASRIEELVADYVVQGGRRDDPRISPLYAEFPSPPPVQIHVSETEILLDDARRMASRLRVAGGDVDLRIAPDLPHVWPIFDGFTPEARQTLKDTARFIRASFTPPLPPPEPANRSDN